MKLDADFLERKLIDCTKGKFLVVRILHLLDLWKRIHKFLKG